MSIGESNADKAANRSSRRRRKTVRFDGLGKRGGRRGHRANARQYAMGPLLVMAVFTIATWWIGFEIPEFDTLVPPQPIDFQAGSWDLQPQAIPDPDGAEHLFLTSNGGQITFSNAAVTLNLPATGVIGAEFRRPVVPVSDYTPMHVRFTADLSTRDVVTGSTYWHAAVLHATLYDREGRRLGSPFLTVLDGTDTAVPVDRVVAVPDSAATMGVLFRLFQSQGSATLANIKLGHVVPSEHYHWVRLVVLACWAAVMLGLAYRYRSQWRSPQGVTLLLILAGLLIGILMPRLWMTQIVASIRDWWAPLVQSGLQVLAPQGGGFEVAQWLSSHERLPKLGHAVVFLLLGLLVSFSATLRRLPLWYLASWFVLLAFATEGMQLFVTDRNTRLFDVIYDLSGTMAGVLLACIVLLPRWLRRQPAR